MKDLLDKLVKKNIPEAKQGTVASYIPELDKARKDALGLYIIDVEAPEIFSGAYFLSKRRKQRCSTIKNF